MKSEHPRNITVQFLADYFQIDLEEAIAIHTRLERVVYNNNETIVTIGDKADGLYFLEDGQATVYNASGEAVNEMVEGQYFGEYAILADEPRLSTVRAHGRVVAYRMSPEDFLFVVGKHPKITGRLLKQVYGQISIKHTKLVSLTRKNRGVMWAPEEHKDTKLSGILITYGLTLAVFLTVFFLAPFIDSGQVWWQILPVVFLMAFTIRTRRIVEGMLLTVMLLGGMLHRGNFVEGLGKLLVEGIGNTGTSSTIVIMAMVEAVAALLAAAGVVSAFKKLAQKHAKTKRGSFFGMLLIMIAACMDECLNVVTAGYCMNEALDEHKVPRESRAILGSFSMAICALIPFSLWSSYISGWIFTYMRNGGNVFLETIPFNLAGIVALLFAVMLCLGWLPKSKQVKLAYKRVENGGKLWPEGSEQYIDEDASDGVVGRPMNLLLPMLVWAASSVVCGMIKNPGSFAMDGVSGLIITLIFMFFLYVGQRLMTPKTFFDTMAGGIANALMPILLLVLAERIAACLDELGFNAFLEFVIPKLVGGHMFLVPMVIFLLCSLLGIGIRSCWGMYGLGIPLALYLSTGLGLNMQLCLGAALSAGIIGESLCPYMDTTSPVVTAIGCNPVVYRKLRFQYWIPIAILCMLGYLGLGLIFC